MAVQEVDFKAHQAYLIAKCEKLIDRYLSRIIGEQSQVSCILSLSSASFEGTSTKTILFCFTSTLKAATFYLWLLSSLNRSNFSKTLNKDVNCGHQHSQGSCILLRR